MTAFDQDLVALEAFRETLPPFFDLDAVREARPADAVVAAALRGLRTAYTVTPPPRYDQRTDAAMQLAAMVLGAVGGYGQQVFDEIALRVSHPAAHKELAPLLRTILADDLVSPLLTALDSDDPQTVRMALSLARWAFFGRWAAPLTPGQAQLFNADVTMRQQRGETDAGLRAELEAWIPLLPNP